MKKKLTQFKKTNFITKSAIIAALYVALTLLISAMSFGPIQLRFGEVLTVLPLYTFAAVPGLAIGCVVSNIIGAAQGLTGFADVFIGSAATLIAAILSYKLRKNKFLVPLPPVVVNAIVVGFQLRYFWGESLPLWACIAQVFAGQAIVCYGLGLIVILAVEKSKVLLKLLKD